MRQQLPVRPEEFWTSLMVDVEALGEGWQSELEDYVGRLAHADLAELESLLGMPSGDAAFRAQRAKGIAHHDQAKTLAFIRAFGLRKLPAVDEVWPYRRPDTKFDGSAYVKLVLLYQKDPDILWDVFVADRWWAKSSGAVFVPEEPSSVNPEALWGTANHDALAAFVAKTTKRSVRVVRTYITKDFTIALLFRGEPKLVEGFLRPERMNTARDILVQLSTASGQGLLTIKSVGQAQVGDAIKEFFQAAFETQFTERPDLPFQDYDERKVSQAFKTGGATRDESLRVRAIALRSHTLPGGPVVAIEADSGQDVGDAFADAVKQNESLFTINSLLDIDRVDLDISGQGNGRTVKVECLPSSEVVFRMSDHAVSPIRLKQIGESFLARFGVPINRPIDHTKFAVGLGRQYDFLLSCGQEHLVPIYQRPLLGKLRRGGLVKQTPSIAWRCFTCGALLQGAKDRCADHPTAYVEEVVTGVSSVVDPDEARASLAKLLKQGKWAVSQVTHRVNQDEYQFFKVTRDNFGKRANSREEIWVYPAFDTLSVTDFKNLQSLLAPILVVWVGKARLSHQAAEIGMIPSVTLGTLLAWADLGELADQLERTYSVAMADVPQRMSAAATRAGERLAKLLIPGPVIEYTPDQFEYDVYTILKCMFPLTVQLGGKRRGQAVPDGILDYWIENQKPWQPYLFMYDAKLSIKGTGYDLGLPEERKAWDYIAKAEQSAVLESYMNGKALSGYLFISNCYQDSQPQKVFDFIRDHSDWTGPVVCLTVKDLLLIFGYWRKYRLELMSKEQNFRRALTSLLVKANPSIRESTISEQFLDLVQSHTGVPAQRLNVDELVDELTR